MKKNARIGTAKLLAVAAITGALLAAAVPSTATAEEWVCPGMMGGSETKLGKGEPISEETVTGVGLFLFAYAQDVSTGWVEIGGIRLNATYATYGFQRFWAYDIDGDGIEDEAFQMQGSELYHSKTVTGELLIKSWGCEEQ